MIDKRRMFQFIVNGLSNAGKFTPSGVVAVDVRFVNDGINPQYMVVTVSNSSHGAGIKDPEALFIPFRGTHDGAAPSAAGISTRYWWTPRPAHPHIHTHTSTPTHPHPHIHTHTHSHTGTPTATPAHPQALQYNHTSTTTTTQATVVTLSLMSSSSDLRD